MKNKLFPLFVQIQALGPFLGARSREILQNSPIESSVRFNLTDLVTKQGSMFASKKVFLLPHTSFSYLHCLQRHHHRKNGKRLFTSHFYTESSYPIFPVVTFRDRIWEQGQMASRHLAHLYLARALLRNALRDKS